MNLLLQRYKDDGSTTLGKLYEVTDGEMKFLCHTLEDERRDLKVRGETRIPAGEYKVKQRRVLSGLTLKYRERFDWFDYHFELQDVPGFQYVYIHVGNYDEDTDGCILVGMEVYENQMIIGESVKAYKMLYPKLKESENITIRILDEYD